RAKAGAEYAAARLHGETYCPLGERVADAAPRRSLGAYVGHFHRPTAFGTSCCSLTRWPRRSYAGTFSELSPVSWGRGKRRYGCQPGWVYQGSALTTAVNSHDVSLT